jgi:hypothetical protein
MLKDSDLRGTPLVWFLPFLFLAAGLALAFHPMVRSGFDLLPGDIGDGRLNHYFLEHGWLWLSGNPAHASFWDAPFFFPYKNVMAYSDILLGTAPIYWVARWSGASGDFAYQIWAISLFILNYSGMLLLLRLAFRFDLLPSIGGAYLFAFCAPRIFKLMHIQLAPQFFTPVFILLLIVGYRAFKTGQGKILAWCCLGSTLSLVGQLYAGFYLGWFLVFGFMVFVVTALCFQPTRQEIITLVVSKWLVLTGCLLLAGLSVYPMAGHYLAAINDVGGPSFSEVQKGLPRLLSWFNSPSYVYREFFDQTRRGAQEHLMGIGLFSLMAAWWGLWRFRASGPWERALVWSAFFLYAITFYYGPFKGPLWHPIYLFVPGAGAIRAMARIFFLILVPLSIGFAYTLSRLNGRMLILILLFLMMAEQVTPPFIRISKSLEAQRLAPLLQALGQGQGPFLFQDLSARRGPFCEVDAMWAGLKAGRPAINGYSGRTPPGYPWKNGGEPMNQYLPRFEKYLRDSGVTGDIDMYFRLEDGTIIQTKGRPESALMILPPAGTP